MTLLYMFYLGGNAGKSNIEVHDVQFVAVDQVEKAYPVLREVWFGDKDKLHLGGYMPITWADGYDITLSHNKYHGEMQLYFVNVGGYQKDSLAEAHEFGFFVARTVEEAKQKAKESLLAGYGQLHKDNLKDVDDCLLLGSVNSYYIHLVENPDGQPDKPEWQGYRPIGI
ncbi:DUF1543 domain-containing protein [Xenorhabdus bovienii]|uniref:DUF1543 domain-containing protein n=1 Tax=Xenorhabdus bovienii TaxID=40576 RepID=UPI00237CBB0F|nr:DUF1543 domain-containing protein [Xenorhabdus bovienii]MDE1482776.1 DUF1543 domain-containing protein [Xenorhabdus bovienii]MDE9535552.1 DUF1543 domain-containing protein [Xenorhabdus bovienii]MDE9589392.1 DUF1543 domain-containing protein [Xenorhabdus bovienii]